MKPPQLNSKSRTCSRGRKPTARRSQSSLRVRAKTKGGDEDNKSSSCGCYFAILVLLAGLAYYLYLNKDKWGIDKYLKINKYFEPKEEVNSFRPDPVTYEKLKTDLANERLLLRNRFINASTAQEQNEIINQACGILEAKMPDMMRCWLGHPWDFNGTATVPGEGKIACGYYVSVIMRDAGFKVQRIQLAQQPSQLIIRTFLPEKRDLWINGGMPYDEYTSKLESKYEGINIVGLDKHVAFVVVQNGEMRFVHSGGLLKQVVDEAKLDAHSLKVSNYRVIGNLTRNRDMLQRWILGDPFSTAR